MISADAGSRYKSGHRCQETACDIDRSCRAIAKKDLLAMDKPERVHASELSGRRD